MTHTVGNLVDITPTNISTELTNLSLAAGDGVVSVVKGNSVVFTKIEDMFSTGSNMVADYKLGSDLVGSDLTITTTGTVKTMLVFKSGFIVHTDDYSVVHSATSSVITFGVPVAADEQIVVIGFY